MTLNRVLAVAALLAVSPSWAMAQSGMSNQAGRVQQPAVVASPVGTPEEVGIQLQPRKALPKRAVVIKPEGESRLAIKFRDEVLARAQSNKSVRFSTNADRTTLDQVISEYGLTFEPANHSSQEALDLLTMRAAMNSRKAQPDLAGMMYVDAASNPQAAANALLKLDCVEYVFFQKPWVGYGGPPGTCCIPNGQCWDVADAGICTNMGGLFTPNVTCATLGFSCPGACCLPDGTCANVVDQNACNGLGGLDPAAIFNPGQSCPPFGGANCPAADVPPPPPPAPQGACCLAPNVCFPLLEFTCAAAGGVFYPLATDCNSEQCDFDCGDPELASCYVVHAYPFCRNDACCTAVGEIRPFCIDVPNPPGGAWDELCVAFANLVCGAAFPPNPNAADRCLTPFNEGCLIAHPLGGCLQAPCCYTVCTIDPFCCNGNWDLTCVNYATGPAAEACTPATPTNPVTPLFVALQGYLRPSSWANQCGGLPLAPTTPLPYPAPAIPNYPGNYGGQGMNLFAEGNTVAGPPACRLTDNPSMVVPQRYEGIYGLGRELQQVYGIGTANNGRGAGIKVAILDHAFYSGHEDLNVTPEPGQTMIMIPGIGRPSHGTAVSGIIGALNDAKGMVGVAPDAQLFFFPLTSAEEGVRYQTAFTNAFTILSPGDVMCCPFGPNLGPGNLSTDDEFGWTMLALGTDLGVTVFVAAGDFCQNLDDIGDDLGDSGAIIVGAAAPGTPFCRVATSNYYQQAPVTSSNRVHMSGYGQLVATTGGSGDLFLPNGNWNRSYTSTFSGTSAACAMAAGAAACVQGICKQFFGIPIAPFFLRQALMDGSFLQCGTPTPPGLPDDIACGPDANPQFQPRRIGGFVRPRVTADLILSTHFPGTGFDQSPQLEAFWVLRGNLAYGNLYSIKGSDNNYMVVQSLYTQREHVVNLVGAPGEATAVAHEVKYLATGFTMDLMVRAKAPPGKNWAIQFTTEVLNPDPTALVFTELFDWTSNRWVFVGVDPLTATAQGAEIPIPHDAQGASRFVNRTNRNVYGRIYILSSGDTTAPPNGFQNSAPGGLGMRIDWVNVSIVQGFGAISIGP